MKRAKTPLRWPQRVSTGPQLVGRPNKNSTYLEKNVFYGFDYFRNKMLLDQTAQKADKTLRQEVKTSLKSRFRRFDNWVHNLKHG